MDQKKQSFFNSITKFKNIKGTPISFNLLFGLKLNRNDDEILCRRKEMKLHVNISTIEFKILIFVFKCQKEKKEKS